MALTQTRAQERITFIKPESISYRFHLTLEAGSSYEGLSEIKFSLLKVPGSVPLDCKVKEIKQLFING